MINPTRNIDQLHIEVAADIKADAVVQGTYWDADKNRGGFIGCLTHSSDPRPAHERFGLTEPIMRLAEHIFENLPSHEAKAFSAAFPDAVGQDGKDLSRVHWQFLASELRTLPRTTDTVDNVVDRTIAGMDLLAQGKQWSGATDVARVAFPAVLEAHDAARDVARVSFTAADEARAAANAALVAGKAANAADEVWVDYAPRVSFMVREAARYAADAVGWINTICESAIRRQRDLLLQLVKDAPMGDV